MNTVEGRRRSDLFQETRPTPDPTTLTTEALKREAANLREILTARYDGALAEVSSRLDAISRLQEEKFLFVEKQFKERDDRYMLISSAARQAIEAALTSATEATQKSDAAFSKQIDQQSQLIRSMEKTSNDKIDDLKSRLGRMEGEGYGKRESKDDSRWMIGTGIAVIVAAITVAGAWVKSSQYKDGQSSAPIIYTIPTTPAAPTGTTQSSSSTSTKN